MLKTVFLILSVLLNLVLIAILAIQNKDVFLTKDFVKKIFSPNKDLLHPNQDLSKTIKTMQAEIARLQTDMNHMKENQSTNNAKIKDYLQNLFSSKAQLTKRVALLEKNVVGVQQKTTVKKEVILPTSQQTVSIHLDADASEAETTYLRNFKNGILSECGENEAQYKITQKFGDSQAKFAFCGNESAAIATKDATFSEVCEVIGWSSQISHITNLEEGRIQMYSERKWKVITPAKVKCK